MSEQPQPQPRQGSAPQPEPSATPGSLLESQGSALQSELDSAFQPEPSATPGLQPAVVEVVQGDITMLEIDAIVNAANRALRAGSGVCGAIFAAAGRAALTASCAAIGGCATGSAVATPSHGLAARGIAHIIHAVGPKWFEHTPDEADRLLASAYRAALDLAEQLGATSIAFPSISTGVYGFPRERAAAIAVAECTRHRGNLRRIVLTAFDAESHRVISTALEQADAAG